MTGPARRRGRLPRRDGAERTVSSRRPDAASPPARPVIAAPRHARRHAARRAGRSTRSADTGPSAGRSAAARSDAGRSDAGRSGAGRFAPPRPRTPATLTLLAPWLLLLALVAPAGAQSGAPAATAAGPAPADEPAPTDRVFIELRADRTEVFVHQPVLVTLRVGVETRFLEEQLLQLFRRRLDVPVQIDAPDWREPSGATTVPSTTPERGPFATVAVGTAVLGAVPAPPVEIDGRPFSVFELRHRFAPRSAGSLVLAAPGLRLAYATRFRDDLVGGRVPEDRRDVLVQGAPLTLDVLPIPEEGRPAGFTGGVGRLWPEVLLEPSRLQLGDRARMRLIVHADGPADLLALRPPRLEDVYGFKVNGLVDDRRLTDASGDRRVLTYDVTLVADVPRVPSIPFVSFDPGPPPRWVEDATAELPIEVLLPEAGPGPSADAGDGAGGGPSAGGDGRGGVGAEHDRAGPEADDDPLSDRDPPIHRDPRAPGAGAERFPAWLWAVALGLLAVVAWRARGRRRSSEVEERWAQARARVLAAVAVVRHGAALADAGAESDELLVSFLADCLDRRPSVVRGPDLASRLADEGLPDELAARAADLHERLAAPRYGGPAPPDGGRPELSALVDAFEAWARGPG